jgi:hypothetical protein
MIILTPVYDVFALTSTSLQASQDKGQQAEPSTNQNSEQLWTLVDSYGR